MARRKSVDRQLVLRLAEDIVNERGAGALTIDALAKSAGISKGGVQSCFGSKEALIMAMQQRSREAYERHVQELAGQDASAIERLLAHVQITQSDDEKSQRRAAALLALLLQTPENLVEARIWYQNRRKDLDVATPAGRNARLAFLATEGLFFLRFFNFMDIDDVEWNAALSDIRGLFEPD